jgi:hypothetical protein
MANNNDVPVLTRMIRAAFAWCTTFPRSCRQCAIPRTQQAASCPYISILKMYARAKARVPCLLPQRPQARATQLAVAELPAFEAAAAKAEWFLEHLFLPCHPGLALFAACETEYLYAVPLPHRPDHTVAWGKLPLLAALEFDDHERVTLALFDRRRTRLFTLFLGAIVQRHALQCEPTYRKTGSTTDGTRQPGYVQHTAPGAREVFGGALSSAECPPARTRMACSCTLEILSGHSRAHCAHIHSTGCFSRDPRASPAVLLARLPRLLQARFAGHLSLAVDASESVVLGAMRHAAEVVERQGEWSWLIGCEVQRRHQVQYLG